MSITCQGMINQTSLACICLQNVVQRFALRTTQLWYGDKARWVRTCLIFILEQIPVGCMYDTSQNGLSCCKRQGLSPRTDSLTQWRLDAVPFEQCRPSATPFSRELLRGVHLGGLSTPASLEPRRLGAPHFKNAKSLPTSPSFSLASCSQAHCVFEKHISFVLRHLAEKDDIIWVCLDGDCK
jgi:hypothetical protein